MKLYRLFLFFMPLILSTSIISATTHKNLVRPHTTLTTKIKNIISLQQKNIKQPAPSSASIKSPIKDWNLIVYMAANNNLHRFALHNFRQMLRIGSTEHINVLLQIDEFGESEVTRFYVEQNNATIHETISNTTEAISGTPESLYGFLRWAIKSFPAKHHAVLLWNHGSGIKDPSIWGKYYGGNRDKFFYKNPKTGLLQVRKKSSQLSNDNNQYNNKGIAFNEVHQTYINNQELRLCLEKTCTELLGSKKIDIIFMDACHMGMIEIASKLKKVSDYLVGSEEIEPGTGYNYTFLLEPFLRKSLSPSEFAQHAVLAYQAEYIDAFADFTQAAISLKNFEIMEQKFFNFSAKLLNFISKNHDNFMTIRRIRKSNRDTSEFFDEDYIDLRHFLKSVITMLQNNKNFVHKDNGSDGDDDDDDFNELLANNLEEAAVECITEYDRKIIASTTGVNLPRAGGFAVYFPKKLVHHSYFKTIFSQSTLWSDFISDFVKKNREI
ncbi:hypothetical protein JST56_05150 [Candidatus Dependentiae bacterium]|jgi:hypothetical protein|nr:hypothetical protein [Candidatus Dependentiae bacterium]